MEIIDWRVTAHLSFSFIFHGNGTANCHIRVPSGMTMLTSMTMSATKASGRAKTNTSGTLSSSTCLSHFAALVLTLAVYLFSSHWEDLLLRYKYLFNAESFLSPRSASAGGGLGAGGAGNGRSHFFYKFRYDGTVTRIAIWHSVWAMHIKAGVTWEAEI